MSDNSFDGLKQRLVGAFVILSLAVIFLPMIFDKPHHAVTSQVVELPPRPALSPVEVKPAKQPKFEPLAVDPKDEKIKPQSKVAESVAPVERPAALASAESSGPSKPAKMVAAAATPTVSELPVFKNVWMVQLGTFSQAENAYKLRDRLRNDGFDGHTKKITVKGATAVRVFAGPYVNKQEASRTKKRVDDKYKVNSLLVHFDG